MKPILSDNIFSTDQLLDWDVKVYDTPHTVASKGLEYRPATPKSSFGDGIDFSTASLSSMNTHFDNNTTPGITDSSGTEVKGRIPVVYDYWGTQAPLGVTKAGRAAIRIKGQIKESGNYGFIAMGQGYIKVFVDGSLYKYGRFDENNPAYNSSTVSVTAGDEIEIFYWTKEQDWAGFAIRVVDGTAFSSGELVWSVVRESDILSASFADAGDTVNTYTLEEVEMARVSEKAGQSNTCDVTLTAAAENNAFGWSWNHNTRSITNVNTSQTIKRGHLIRVEGGVSGDKHDQFTGHVVDIQPNDETVVLKCNSLEYRLVQQLSENYPDRLSYSVFGYTSRDGIENPVWNVPAYDHWPYEHAVKDMLYRAWIDASLMSGKKSLIRVGESTAEDGSSLLRAKSLTGDHIRITRQANYGNPDGSPDSPPDDDYLTSSELTNTLYNRINNLVDRIGYYFKTDGSGNFVLRPRNNPDSIQQISGGTTTTQPAAIGGTYEKFTGTGWSVSITDVKASRIELVLGRGVDLGKIDVAISRQEDSFSDSLTIDTSHDEQIFYYDNILTADASNAAVSNILSGEDYGTYDITITPNGGTGSTEYRLDTLRIFEQDPVTPVSDFFLRSLENAIELKGQSNTTDHINDAIVTGVRKSTITDSQKAVDKVSTEFVTSRSTDVDAIFNPNAENYDGRKITSFLSDESVADQDLADWLSRTLVSRYRVPNPELRVKHTIIPVVEIRDPIKIKDDKFDAYDQNITYWVTGFTHTFKPEEALTDINLTPFEETPSFEPREEIDISLFGNKPVINLDISYPSLSGSGTVSNPQAEQAVKSDLVSSKDTIKNDGSFYIDVDSGTMSPGTELLQVPKLLTNQGQISNTSLEYLKNNPYNKFYEKSGGRLNLPFEMADGESQYKLDGDWGLGTGDSATFTFHKIQDVYSGTSPFYDPYYSELNVPELIDITFDALVSGYYRVSIIDARDNDPITVAWLTNPSVTDTDPDKHWSYITAGPEKEYTWDGVDNIGRWNRTQTEDYKWRQRNNFEIAENPEISRGFYCFNDQTTAMTHISDELESSEAVYPIGNYAQFYVKVEVVRSTDSVPLVVKSDTKGDLKDTNGNDVTPRYIYYHLPEPNKATISIEDWDISSGDYDPSNPTDNWLSSPDADATIRNTKPVRISITAQKRKGSKFSDNSLTNIKVFRTVNLSSLIWDETAILTGQPWNGKSLSVEEKKLVSRRLNQDEFSIIFKDDFFVSGDNIEDWVFIPSDVEKDFGTGEEELDFRDYLQMTEVPSWNPQRRSGEERSRHLMAMMGYLFYLSVFTQDRSGRLVWCVDDSFVDKSKILDNTDTTEFPYNLERHQRRTVFVRQWWDYDDIDSDLGSSGYNVPQKHYGAYTDRFDYHSRSGSDKLFPLANTTSYVTGNVETTYTDEFSLDTWEAGRLDLVDGVSKDTFDRDLGGSASNTVLGNWTWETDGFLWIPSISRDFHPFYIVPPMGLVSYEDSDRVPFWWKNYIYAVVAKDEADYDNWFTVFPLVAILRLPGINVKSHYQDQDGNPIKVPDNTIQIQRQDDIKHYENCRGGFSNSSGGSRDLINLVGGDPLYLNTKLYRYFRMRWTDKARYYNDVWRKGWFFSTFRHTYNWESPSLFPVDTFKFLQPGALDSDITGSPLRANSYDIGAYTGWKDDHPSSMQQGQWKETGTCDNIHWRNDKVGDTAEVDTNWNAHAGGVCSISDPTTALEDEDLEAIYQPNKNIFLQRGRIYIGWGDITFRHRNYIPMAVGPRLPQTRRVLMSLVLVNNRRTSEV